MEDIDSRWLKLYKEKGWLTTDEDALELIKGGYEVFCLNLVDRVMNDSSEKVFLNTCPKCDQLTVTPQSRQCSYCYHKWHEMRVATFELNSSFQLHDRDFFLLGIIKSGEVKVGNFIDLTIIGLNSKPEITDVEFALRNIDGKMIEHLRLGTNSLRDEDKEYLKKMGCYGGQIDIVNSK